MVELNKKKKGKNVVQMKDLKDGQIAVVVDREYPSYCGTIVQMYENHGVPIGKPSGKGWTFGSQATIKVRILREGERLTIFDNE